MNGAGGAEGHWLLLPDPVGTRAPELGTGSLRASDGLPRVWCFQEQKPGHGLLPVEPRPRPPSGGVPREQPPQMPSAKPRLPGALEGPALARPSRSEVSCSRGGGGCWAPLSTPLPATPSRRLGSLCSDATCASVAWWGGQVLGDSERPCELRLYPGRPPRGNRPHSCFFLHVQGREALNRRPGRSSVMGRPETCGHLAKAGGAHRPPKRSKELSGTRKTGGQEDGGPGRRENQKDMGTRKTGDQVV